MKFSLPLTVACLAALTLAQPLKAHNTTVDSAPTTNNNLIPSIGKPYAVFQPKVVIVSMFKPERNPWFKALDLVHNITLPGLSPLFPMVHCTTNYSICQITTGEGEINAASTITAFGLSPLFDLSNTYFLIAGIAGGYAQYTTIGGVTFAKYAVQVALEYEVAHADYASTNSSWPEGYYAYGTKGPNEYQTKIYGTEVFELNEALVDRAVELALSVDLNNGTEGNAKFRALYNETAARSLPQVTKCDVLTSDVYFFGETLSSYFSDYALMMTNGSAKACSTAQEDNATLEALVRLDSSGLVDYSRVVVMRTISDMATPPPSLSNNTVEFFNEVSQGGSKAAFSNLVIAGEPFVRDIVEHWDDVYAMGTYSADNYLGDVFGTLGGEMDFGSDSWKD